VGSDLGFLWEVAFWACLLAACVSDNASDSETEKERKLEHTARTYWEEQLDPKIAYFAGSRFEWQFFGDSVAIVQKGWTDVSECRMDSSGHSTCTPTSWTHHYSGSFTALDSTLSVKARYHHSVPANAPEPNTKTADAIFRVRYASDSTRLEVALQTGTSFLGTESPLSFHRLEHHDMSIVSAEVSNDCGPADGPETRLTFLPESCPTCTSDSKAPFSLNLNQPDVDSLSKESNYTGSVWRCGELGCIDSAYAVVELTRTTSDSVSGIITLRKGNSRSQGHFTAPKKRQRPFCG
jgi:hypothetical protein